jgi:DNA-binding transcriptional regulator YbjK
LREPENEIRREAVAATAHLLVQPLGVDAVNARQITRKDCGLTARADSLA